MAEQIVYIPFTMQDELHYEDGRVEVLPPITNTIQTSFGKLMADLSSGKGVVAIVRMEVGSGDPGWDAAPPPPAPGTGQTGLLAPIGRSSALVGGDWEYLVTPATTPETVSGSPTSRVRGTVTFAIATVNGTLREAGLYGGTGTTGTNGTGTLVNIFRHAAINKPSGTGDFQLVRKVILQF